MEGGKQQLLFHLTTIPTEAAPRLKEQILYQNARRRGRIALLETNEFSSGGNMKHPIDFVDDEVGISEHGNV